MLIYNKIDKIMPPLSGSSISATNKFVLHVHVVTSVPLANRLDLRMFFMSTATVKMLSKDCR